MYTPPPARRLRREVAHVFRVVLDLVIAGTPRGERDVQRILAAGGKLRAHVEQPRRGRWHRDFVLDAHAALRGERHGDAENEQLTHEPLPEDVETCGYPAQNEAAQTVSPSRKSPHLPGVVRASAA